MGTQIQMGDITVEVVRKKIKNIHLRVCPPTGTVRISVPLRMPLPMVRLFALSKRGWIKAQQKKLQVQKRAPSCEYLDRESHWVWGKRYSLHVVEAACPPSVRLEQNQMILSVRPGATVNQRQAVVEAWHRALIQSALPDLIMTWERMLGVRVSHCTVRKMKTRWGSCTPRTGRIRINAELAKTSPECLEYILVHEMVHLLEPTHNQRFIALMNQHVPQWKLHQAELNRAPIRDEERAEG